MREQARSPGFHQVLRFFQRVQGLRLERELGPEQEEPVSTSDFLQRQGERASGGEDAGGTDPRGFLFSCRGGFDDRSGHTIVQTVH